MIVKDNKWKQKFWDWLVGKKRKKKKKKLKMMSYKVKE